MNSAADLGGFIVLDVTNCSCFCTSHKYETGRTLGNRLDSDQFRGGNGPSRACLLSVVL